MKKIIYIFLFILIMISGGITGCSDKGDKAEKNTNKNEVIVALPASSEPEAGFDPVYGWGAGEHVHEPLIQSTLTVTNANLEIEKDLATDYFVSDDGLVWRVTVRDDVKFTDGEKLTAEDVAFTYNKCRDESIVNDFSMLREAVAVDDTTVEFHMNYAFSLWPYTMAVTGIIPEHAYDENYGDNPVGSGRYIMRQWDVGQQVILEANPNYYGEAPNIKKVTILFMEEDTALAAAQAGEVDMAFTSASYSDADVNGYSLMAVDTVDNRGINLPAEKRHTDSQGIVTGNDFTSDLLVRRAINMGIERSRLIENVLDGYGTPAYSVCDNMPWYNEESEVEYDLDKAKELLDKAGWKESDDGIRTKKGQRAELTLLYPASDSVRQALAEEVKNQLRELGIKVSTKGVGWDTAYEEALSEPLIWGWGAYTPMEFYNIYHTVEDTGTARYSPYSNRIADKYMDDALAENNLDKSLELWKKAQWDGSSGVTGEGDIPWVWLCNIKHLYFVMDNLQIAEQKIHPHGHGWSVLNNVDKWSWK